jgi:predicted dehydrogenase
VPSLKVGMIGAGGVSHSHAPHWVSIGAQVSVYAAAGAGQLAARYGPNKVDSLAELFAASDVVDICTPKLSHCELALAAISAGKHVLCEKPVGRTTCEATVIAAAARAGGVQVYPAHVVRFFSEYAATHAAVAAGAIGIPAVLRVSRGGEGASSDWFFDNSSRSQIVAQIGGMQTVRLRTDLALT